MLKHIITLVAIIAASLTASASRHSDPNPNFKFHASFDNQPRRIVDTQDAVYFFVHPRQYSPSKTYLKTPAGAIFRYDKQNPDLGIHDIRNYCNLSGADMTAFEADPETGAFVIGYIDGGVDVKWADGSVTYFEQIKNRTFNGDAVIKSVQIDPETHDIWVGAASGFICISADTRTVTHEATWRDNVVTSIVAAAGRIVAIIGNKICEAAADARITRAATFTEIPGITSGIAGTPLRILPLTDTHFAYLTTSGVIALVTYNGSAWSVTRLVTDSGVLEKVPVINGADRAAIPTQTGYLFSSASKYYMLNRPATTNGTPAITSVSKPAGASEYAGTYDNSKFWFYYPRGYFSNATLSGTTWSATATPIRPNAPVTCMDATFAYSPTHGLVMSNVYGSMYLLEIGKLGQPAMPAAYKDGVWKDLAGVHIRPQFAESGTSQTLYNNNINKYPVDDPVGVFVDPINPDILHMGSMDVGVVHLNMSDVYGKAPIWTTKPNAAFAGFPTAKTDLIHLDGSVAGYVAGFDGDNTMWIVQSSVWADSEDSYKEHLFYMTAEDRLKMLGSGNPDDSPAWKHIAIPRGYRDEATNRVLALKHPKNKGRLIDASWHWGNFGGRSVLFVNYGDPEDTSDDYIEEFGTFSLPNGLKTMISFGNVMAENQLTGEVAFSSSESIFLIEPGSHPVDGVLAAREIAVKDEHGNEGPLVDPINATALIYDEYNRLWIGSLHSGIIGINTETGELVARYDNANSPMPSNAVLGLGWNPDTQSLFASTNEGVIEIKVDAPVSTAASVFQEPFASPTEIGPDYGGTVAVRNVPAGTSLYVQDRFGKTVAVLPTPESGVTYWNLLDQEGKRVATGQYTICDISVTATFPKLSVSVVR